MSEPEDETVVESAGRHGLPPASFEFSVLSLRAQTEMQLGSFILAMKPKSRSRILNWLATVSTC